MATRTAASVARRSPASSRSAAIRPTGARSAPPRRAAAPAVGLRLTLAKTGDHGVIHKLLLSIFHGPSAAEFHAQLDEPGYAPADRLIVKDGEQIAAHLRLARQTIQVGEVALPAARFMDLATAPEYRSRGLASNLLTAGERAAASRGVLVGLTRTRAASLFARSGWAVCGRHYYSSAAPRAVLAELRATAGGGRPSAAEAIRFAQPAAEPIVVRPLRRIELPALVRLYEQNRAGRSGWPLRDEDYWDWLLARGACDQIYVAGSGGPPAELPKLADTILGYACIRQCRLVEVLTAPGRDDVARQLAARVCADASEQDDWLVRCDAPPEHSVHELFCRAGGQITSGQELGGELFMARLLDPLAALRHLAGTFAARASAAGLPRPSELGVELRSGGGGGKAGGVVERFRLHLARRGARIETGGPSRHTIILRDADLAPLVLGDQSAADLIAAGRLRGTTRQATEIAVELFPTGNWWRPPLDDLLA